MKWWTLLGVILGLGGAFGAAQSETYYVIERGSPARVVEIGTDGAAVRVVASLPQYFSVTAATSRADNRGILLGGYGSPAELLSVSDSGVVATLYSGVGIGPPAYLLPGDDGEMLVFPRRPTSAVLALRGGMLSTVTTMAPMLVKAAVHDPAGSGQVVCRGLQGTTIFDYTYGYWYLDPRTGTFSSFCVDPVDPLRFTSGARDIDYDAPNDVFVDFVIEATNVTSFLTLDPEVGVRSSLLITDAHGVDMVRASGRAFPVRSRMLSRSLIGRQPDTLIDLRADGVVVGRRSLSGVAPTTFSPLLRRGGRHVSRVLNTPPDDRFLQVSFPGEAGRPFVVLFSASGMRPGLRLSDGRVVSIVPDNFTVVSLRGGVPGVLGPTSGVLDASGRATVRVNANPFGSAARGLVLHFVVAVLDPRAPSGVAHLVGPEVLRIR